MQVTNLYTSVACNRTTQCADWGPSGLIAFGACNAVAVLDPRHNENSAKILFTLVEHTNRVNTVKWLDEYQIISGSDDTNAVLWKLDGMGAKKRIYLKGHKNGVNAVDGVRQQCGVWLLATAAADNTIKLWHMDPSDDISCFQTVDLAGGFCFSLRVTMLPKSEQVLLAFSSDDESISLYAERLNDNNDISANRFELVHKLSGHEDWVRALDFVSIDDYMLLASGSQDNFIRLWRIASRSKQQACENRINDLNFNVEDSGEIRVEEKIIQVGEKSWYAVSLESVLYGHEGWVYGVHWHKNANQELRLLSASIDKTVIVWAPTEEGVWLEQVRVGDVGGNSMGFFGGKFAHDGRSIMAHSYQGGFHIWNQSQEQMQIWTSNVIVGGHYGQVRDLAWEHEGAYIMTVSSDQTTRLHAPWLQADKSTTWHEMARPQIHGYDMQTLALLSRYKFASGAEEKIVRTFQAPANFIENFRHICGLDNDAAGDALLDSLPKGASVPSLGLSNKAVYKVEAEPNLSSTANKSEYPENYFVPITLQTPPQEETLMQNTLWPEMQKLYGHGYELYAVAATHDGQLLASTCRASNSDHAQIIIWNTVNWKQLQKLSGHQLTVTQMRFSPDARYLLSVSRDRRWSLYERQHLDDPLSSFALVANLDKNNGVHARIIWSCDWSHDGKYFATSSRDGKVVVWMKNSVQEEKQSTTSSLNGWEAAGTLELKNESITAVTFAQRCLDEQKQTYLLAMGTESGIIKIYQFTQGIWHLSCDLNKDSAHHLTVKRLQFRPGQELQLASCGEDHLVRIYDIKLNP